MKYDTKLSQLAKSKHEGSKLVMKPMVHALEVLANSNKHINANNNQNVIDTKFGEVKDWLSYFKGHFPTIVTETAEYPLWKLQEILIEYFEWVFDESETNPALKPNILIELDKFQIP